MFVGCVKCWREREEMMEVWSGCGFWRCQREGEEVCFLKESVSQREGAVVMDVGLWVGCCVGGGGVGSWQKKDEERVVVCDGEQEVLGCCG